MTTVAERYRIDPNEIKVGERFRKDSGDLTKLMKSMDRQGLLHPLVVSSDNWLICGFRRLEAAKKLHWTHVEVKNFYGESILQAEYDENECRLDFTVSERTAIARAIAERIGERRGRPASNGGKEIPPNWAELPPGEETRAFAARKAVVFEQKPV